MNWLFFALLTTIFAASAALTQKKVLFKQHALEFAFILSICNFIVSLPLFFKVDYSSLSLMSLLFVFIATFIGGLAFLLVAKSVRHLEVSESSPLLVLGPGITAIFAFGILGETLSFIQVGGILLLMLGAYVLETKRHQSIMDPIRVFKKSKYAHFILIALFLYAICAVFDKVALTKLGIDPSTYIAFVHLFLIFHFIVLMKFFKFDFKLAIVHAKPFWPLILLVAFFTVGYRFSQMMAIKDANVGLVSAMKRSSALLVTVVGGRLFHEENLVRKIVACCIMLCGVLLIVL